MPDSVETLLRQLVAGQATLGAQFEGLSERVDIASKDAREARDLGHGISAKLEEQNIVARMTELKNELGIRVDALRTDVVQANTNLKKDLASEVEARQALERRVESLEAERNKVVGVASFFSWMARVAPWLFAGIAAFVAGMGLEDKMK